MAVGGAGDVLTGVICGLLAQGMAPFDAAALGVYLHGLSGDAACRRHGAYGMIARDIANETGLILQSMEKAGGK
jgi:NAD(P)H-hydrate epimerase